MLTKSLLQALAEPRRRDAEVLILNGQVCRRVLSERICLGMRLEGDCRVAIHARRHPPKKLVNDTYTHELVTLVGLAGIKSELDKQITADQDFTARWGFVSKWSEASRYENWDAATAHSRYAAVADPTKGVLRWLKQFW